jgi:hypothetical protein
VSVAFRQALLAAWFAQNHTGLTETELAAAAVSQVHATPDEVTQLISAWRDRHEPDIDAGRGPAGRST